MQVSKACGDQAGQTVSGNYGTFTVRNLKHSTLPGGNQNQFGLQGYSRNCAINILQAHICQVYGDSRFSYKLMNKRNLNINSLIPGKCGRTIAD